MTVVRKGAEHLNICRIIIDNLGKGAVHRTPKGSTKSNICLKKIFKMAKLNGFKLQYDIYIGNETELIWVNHFSFILY